MTQTDSRIEDITNHAHWLQSEHTHNERPTHCDECGFRWPCDTWDDAVVMLWLLAQLQAAQDQYSGLMLEYRQLEKLLAVVTTSRAAARTERIAALWELQRARDEANQDSVTLLKVRNELQVAQEQLREAEDLHGDVNWLSNERRLQIQKLEAKSNQRRDALVMIEWVYGLSVRGVACPACRAFKVDGHVTGCSIALAIEE